MKKKTKAKEQESSSKELDPKEVISQLAHSGEAVYQVLVKWTETNKLLERRNELLEKQNELLEEGSEEDESEEDDDDEEEED